MCVIDVLFFNTFRTCDIFVISRLLIAQEILSYEREVWQQCFQCLHGFSIRGLALRWSLITRYYTPSASHMPYYFRKLALLPGSYYIEIAFSSQSLFWGVTAETAYFTLVKPLAWWCAWDRAGYGLSHFPGPLICFLIAQAIKYYFDDML